VPLRLADVLVNLLVLVGLALIVAGCWFVSPPLGLIVGGLAVLVVAAIVAAPVRRRT
jgi:hypothetical protein